MDNPDVHCWLWWSAADSELLNLCLTCIDELLAQEAVATPGPWMPAMLEYMARELSMCEEGINLPHGDVARIEAEAMLRDIATVLAPSSPEIRNYLHHQSSPRSTP